MKACTVRIQSIEQAKTSKLFPEFEGTKITEGNLESVGILEAGMQSGDVSLGLNVRMPDGSLVWVQVTPSILTGIHAAMKGAQERFANQRRRN